jgi:hypothetical protein
MASLLMVQDEGKKCQQTEPEYIASDGMMIGD